MIIPTSGRVVIVDDKIDQIGTLMNTLSQNGIAFTYFNGTIDTLPPKPLDGITYMFLDLELDEALTNDKTKASQDIEVMHHILGDNCSNQSVVIIVWSEALTILSQLRSMMIEADIKPLALLEINKTDCKNLSTGEFVFDKVVQQIDMKLSEIPSLALLTMWDNMVGKACHNVCKRVLPSNTLPHSELNQHLNAIYKQLAIANLGKKYVSKDQPRKDQTLAVVNTLNSILSNDVSKISNLEDLHIELDLDNITGLSLIDLAQLNAGINIDPCPQKKHPGCVFNNDFTSNKVTGFDIFEDKDEVKHSCKSDYEAMLSICCEVTPLCDYAQKRSIYHRLLTGLAIPATLAQYTKSKADYLYKSPIFYLDGFFDNKAFFLVLDLRHFFTISKDGLQDKTPFFQLGDSITMHLQNRLGRQVSNPGITFIDNNSED